MTVPENARGIMIDRATALDRDDAIWAEAVDDGWELTVHVACVADAVRLRSPADQRAARQAQTLYLRNGTIPMLPRPVEAAATLSATHEQPTVQVTWHVAPDGVVSDERIREGRLRRPVAMDYAAATAGITDRDHPRHEALTAAHDAAWALLGRRRASGALVIYDLIRGWASDGDGGLRQLATAERHAAYMIVAEFMVCANTLIAGHCVSRDIPVMFRNHQAAAAAPPREQLIGELRLAAGDGGEDWQREAARQKLGHLLRPAVYAVHASGHYGLRLPWYCHATSPLRRYPDLIVQRQLLAAIRGKQPPHDAGELEQLATAVNTTIRERRERRAEQQKEHMKRQRRDELAAAGYEELSPEQFHRLLKLAVKEGLHSRELEAELLRRIAGGGLLARDAYPVLMSAAPEWEPARAALTGWLARHPEHAVTLTAIHAVNLGMDAPLWEEAHAGTVQQPLFSARAGLAAEGEVTWSATRVAQRKDAARQQAALSLIAGIAGQPDPSATDPVPVAGPAAGGTTPGTARRSPVTVLNELAQTGVLLNLGYAYAQSGPPHDPQFTCTATARHAASGRPLAENAAARTKKDAKNAAAQCLLDAIPRRLKAHGEAAPLRHACQGPFTTHVHARRQDEESRRGRRRGRGRKTSGSKNGDCRGPRGLESAPGGRAARP